ncbi:MAG: transposase [Anaerolineae bacterium]|nr:transposase [Anaerolineae bacterium]
MLEGFDPNQIQDLEGARQAIVMLLNLVETLKTENQELREQVQHLRDEINRLKGEQGKPNIKPNGKKRASSDHSSEQERRKPKERKKRRKLDRVKIDRVEELDIEPERLPADAEFKGHEEVTVQDISIHTDNVLFRKRKYYSVSENKTYLAELPPGYEGEYGPGIKSLAIVMHFGMQATEPKILEFFAHFGIQLSAGQLSNILIKDKETFHAEKEAIYEAGLRSSPWQHIDETGARVNGQNQHCHIVCNPLYSAYFTTEKKDRLTVIDVLRNSSERRFLLNDEACELLRSLRVSARLIGQLNGLPREQELGESEFTGLLNQHLPDLGPQQRSRILDAAAISAYHAQTGFPVVELLICDDAPQFKLVTNELSLCWIHEGRHYKKLIPHVAYHRQLLDDFLKRYWNFYGQLLVYRRHPSEEDRIRLSEEFDELFSTVSGYEALDERIAKTKAKKASMLMVLVHPEIPLHNNSAELAARKRVRRRKISFGTRSEDGTKAWDTFATLEATAKKLGVSFYEYIYDRIAGAYKIPGLADLISRRVEHLRLGASWLPP